MIIEIESFYGDCYLHGKSINIYDLNEQVKSVLADVDEERFVPIFCSRFGYDKIQIDEFPERDFVIDLDTHLLYKRNIDKAFRF